MQLNFYEFFIRAQFYVVWEQRRNFVTFHCAQKHASILFLLQILARCQKCAKIRRFGVWNTEKENKIKLSGYRPFPAILTTIPVPFCPMLCLECQDLHGYRRHHMFLSWNGPNDSSSCKNQLGEKRAVCSEQSKYNLTSRSASGNANFTPPTAEERTEMPLSID